MRWRCADFIFVICCFVFWANSLWAQDSAFVATMATSGVPHQLSADREASDTPGSSASAEETIALDVPKRTALQVVPDKEVRIGSLGQVIKGRVARFGESENLLTPAVK